MESTSAQIWDVFSAAKCCDATLLLGSRAHDSCDLQSRVLQSTLSLHRGTAVHYYRISPQGIPFRISDARCQDAPKRPPAVGWARAPVPSLALPTLARSSSTQTTHSLVTTLHRLLAPQSPTHTPVTRHASSKRGSTMAWTVPAVIALAVLSASPLNAQDSGWEARSVLKRANTVTAASELADRSFDYGAKMGS